MKKNTTGWLLRSLAPHNAVSAAQPRCLQMDRANPTSHSPDTPCFLTERICPGGGFPVLSGVLEMLQEHLPSFPRQLWVAAVCCVRRVGCCSVMSLQEVIAIMEMGEKR